MDTTNEPVAWMLMRSESCVELTEWYGVMRGWEEFLGDNEKIVELYTHPSEHDLGVAEAIGFDKGYQAATARSQEPDCYGDGTVYRGVRSKDSQVKTYVFDEHAGKQTWSNPAKTLTDEEITKIRKEVWDDNKFISEIFNDFARAILRKVQGK
jgi:hypothetical protein